jgi:hypothetical protein
MKAVVMSLEEEAALARRSEWSPTAGARVSAVPCHPFTFLVDF